MIIYCPGCAGNRCKVASPSKYDKGRRDWLECEDCGYYFGPRHLIVEEQLASEKQLSEDPLLGLEDRD